MGRIHSSACTEQLRPLYPWMMAGAEACHSQDINNMVFSCRADLKQAGQSHGRKMPAYPPPRLTTSGKLVEGPHFFPYAGRKAVWKMLLSIRNTPLPDRSSISLLCSALLCSVSGEEGQGPARILSDYLIKPQQAYPAPTVMPKQWFIRFSQVQ